MSHCKHTEYSKVGCKCQGENDNVIFENYGLKLLLSATTDTPLLSMPLTPTQCKSIDVNCPNTVLLIRVLIKELAFDLPVRFLFVDVDLHSLLEDLVRLPVSSLDS